MIDIKTYQDLVKAGENEQDRIEFILSAIAEHKASDAYRKAKDAGLYADGKNATISKYIKTLYTMTGEQVPDRFTANHRCKSGFFKRDVIQETSFQVGNGVNFQNEGTKERLGASCDAALYKAVKAAIVQGVSFGFFNLDHIEVFYFADDEKTPGFVPLFDESTGQLAAGVRYWQIDQKKPLHFTLFELDGYTDYTRDKNGDTKVLHNKRPYRMTIRTSEADGEEIVETGNYPGFPVVPLWGNMKHQSELEGKREQIDCYDLIKSGFANDLDDASEIYWTIANADGMDDVDLAKFIERMKVVKAANVKNGSDGMDDGGNVSVEAHTVEVPYASRKEYLAILRNDLQDDFMMLDVKSIAAGNVTSTQIKAAYEPLVEKCDELEMCLVEFFQGILALIGVEDTPTFERSWIANQTEQTNMILAAAEYLDDETILRKLPFLTADEIDDILKRKDAEEADRYKQMEEELNKLKNEPSGNSGQFGEEGEE